MTEAFDESIVRNQRDSIPAQMCVIRGDGDPNPNGHLDPFANVCFRGAVHASVYAFMLDSIGGWVADRNGGGDWLTTADLSVRMPETVIPEQVRLECTPLRVGRRLISADGTFTDESGRVIGGGTTVFARVPRRPDDPEPPRIDQLERIHTTPLEEPLVEACGLETVDPSTGSVRLELKPGLLNPMLALQGGITAVIAEMSAITLADHHGDADHVVSALDLRYLSMGRNGPITATAQFLGPSEAGMIRVELVDAASGDTPERTIATGLLQVAPSTPV